MYVYVSLVGRLDSQILSNLTMAVMADTSNYNTITIVILLQNFILKTTLGIDFLHLQCFTEDSRVS